MSGILQDDAGESTVKGEAINVWLDGVDSSDSQLADSDSHIEVEADVNPRGASSSEDADSGKYFERAPRFRAADCSHRCERTLPNNFLQQRLRMKVSWMQPAASMACITLRNMIRFDQGKCAPTNTERA